jgi:hypothetical protein
VPLLRNERGDSSGLASTARGKNLLLRSERRTDERSFGPSVRARGRASERGRSIGPSRRASEGVMRLEGLGSEPASVRAKDERVGRDSGPSEGRTSERGSEPTSRVRAHA